MSNSDAEPTSESGGSERPAWVLPVLIGVGLVLAAVLIVYLVTDDDENSDTSTEAAAGSELDSETVMEIQQGLTDLGYYSGPIDGDYGPETVDAVKALQTELGVTADGVVGPETLAALDAAQGGGSTTTAPSTPSTTAPAAAPTVRLTTSDGLDETLVVTKCDNPGETTLSLVAQSEEDENPLSLSLEASGGTGTIVLSGAEEREGTVDSLMVGDTGEITASGTLTPADDSADNATFELVGNCA